MTSGSKIQTTRPPSFHPSSDPFFPVHSAIPTRLNADITSSNTTNHAHAHPFTLIPTPTSYIMPILPSLLADWFRSPPRLYRDPPTRQARQLLGSNESADPKVFQDSATTTAGADSGAAAATTSTTSSAGSTRHADSGTRSGYVVAVVWSSLTPGSNGKAPAYSPNYREEAERIVAEERAQTEKMPRYEVRLAHIVVALLIAGTGRVQAGREDGRRCILKRVQGDRPQDQPEMRHQGRAQV